MRFEASFQTIERCQEHPRTRMVTACYSCLGRTQTLFPEEVCQRLSWPFNTMGALALLRMFTYYVQSDHHLIQWYPMISNGFFVYLCFRFLISNVSGNERPKISQVVVGPWRPCPKYSRHEPNFLKKLLKGVGAAEISTCLAYFGCIYLQWLKCLLWKFSSGFLLGPLFEM